MAIVDGSLQLGYKDNAWFTANASLVLKVGQIVYLEQTGTYKIGDGVTVLSALSFLGGGSGSGVQSVTGNQVDNTDPLNPIVLEQTSLISPDTFTGLNVYDGQASLGSSDGVSDVGNITIDPTTIAQSVTDSVDTSTITIIKDVIEFTSASVTKNSVEIATVQVIASPTSQVAVNDTDYIVNTTTTFTDPSPVEAKGFTVFVRNGTATVGGTAYSVAGTEIKRTFHSGAWVSYVFLNNTQILTQLNSKVGIIAKDITTSSALTGTTAITLVKSVLIPANTFSNGDVCQIITRGIRSTATGTGANYIYINTSASLSGATLVGTQSAASRFYGMERNLFIKSSTVSETYDAAGSLSSDNPVVAANDKADLNINWTVDQYIIHAFSLAAVGNSFVSSGIIVTKM
jgi:hypothetical protein